MKQIVGVEVNQDADVFDTILQYAKQESWIYISDELCKRLRNQYRWSEYAGATNGYIFNIEKENKAFEMFVDSHVVWNEVSKVEEIGGKYYSTCDPKLIVFIS